MLTVEKYVRDYHSRDPKHVEAGENERLWIHDFLHAFLDIPPMGTRREEALSIYQAVLLRDDRVNQKLKTYAGSQKNVTLLDVFTKIMPGMRDHLTHQGSKLGFKPSRHIADIEVELHYYRALAISAAIKDAYGRHLGEMPIDWIKQQSVRNWLSVFNTQAHPSGMPPGSLFSLTNRDFCP